VGGKGARLAQQLIHHGGFAVVHVGDDRDVPDLLAHASFHSCRIGGSLL
jgi:hypothetical protein